MRKAIIVTLVCVNLVLAGALVTVNLQPSTAQTLTLNAKTNYAVTSCVVALDAEAMLILDSATEKLGAFRLDAAGGTVIPYSPIDLKREFK
ncbi:MAG: hypothetical protein HZA50_18235 [Planctomycetes bacterium]|nr:hypothetical protein [Planctomycetota bacterium]